MGKSPLGSADARPRFYIRSTINGRFAWRKGPSGLERGGYGSPASCVDTALATINFAPAVIFWEGRTDHD